MPEPSPQADPWPDDYNPADGDHQRFDPDRPRFADVPVLVRTDVGFDVLRGDVDLRLLRHAAEELAEVPTGTHAGVFIDPAYGTFELVLDGEPVLDPRYRRRFFGPSLPRDLPTFEGYIAALRSYADEVVAFADRLERLRADGWVIDGYEAPMRSAWLTRATPSATSSTRDAAQDLLCGVASVLARLVLRHARRLALAQVPLLLLGRLAAVQRRLVFFDLRERLVEDGAQISTGCDDDARPAVELAPAVAVEQVGHCRAREPGLVRELAREVGELSVARTSRRELTVRLNGPGSGLPQAGQVVQQRLLVQRNSVLLHGFLQLWVPRRGAPGPAMRGCSCRDLAQLGRAAATSSSERSRHDQTQSRSRHGHGLTGRRKRPRGLSGRTCCGACLRARRSLLR